LEYKNTLPKKVFDLNIIYESCFLKVKLMLIIVLIVFSNTMKQAQKRNKKNLQGKFLAGFKS
jgi:hypothetical protein